MLTIDMRKIDDSGIGTYIRSLVPLVLERLPGVRASLIGSPQRLAYLAEAHPERVRIVPVTALPYSLAEQWAIPRAIPRETTLFWSPHYNIPLLYAGRLLVTVHDVFHLACPQWVGGPMKKWYARTMFRAVRRKAVGIIAVSRFTEAEFAQRVGASSRLRTVHNGIDDSWFAIPPAAAPDAPYFLYVGNVKPHKNVGTLIRAFRLVADKLPHRLLIVGRKDGFVTGDSGVDREIGTLADRVTFTGHVGEEQLRRCYARADALVFPSYYEGFGLPPLEAMAAGTPVIASAAAAIPEVCGDAALYFNPASEPELAAALLRVADDAALRRKLRARGRERARAYSWQRCAQLTTGLIAEVMPS